VALGDYKLALRGESCSQTCFRLGMNCNQHIVTNNSSAIFAAVGATCTPNPTPWWAEDQPSVGVSGPNAGNCLGYIKVPGGVLCSGSHPDVQRVCRCDAPSTSMTTFGTGLSSGAITLKEQWVFQHFVAPGDLGVMTHFWVTYPTDVDKGTIIRYYVDGETTASIQFTPSLACGVGSYDPQGPWGTPWFGKGAADGAWFWNFRVPFLKSIVVTTQHQFGDKGGFYMIVRGGTNIPINIGGLPLPATAKLNLAIVNKKFDPLAYIDLAVVQSGQGVFFLHTLAVQSGNLNFLEGCYHMYQNGQEFPGIILSTGTEDYYDSAWYFNAGEFHLPTAGYTHFDDKSAPGVSWSAYRFHEMDPLRFKDGFRLQWRNGDTNAPSGIKCQMETGGSPVGNPTASNVTAYSWFYTW